MNTSRRSGPLHSLSIWLTDVCCSKVNTDQSRLTLSVISKELLCSEQIEPISIVACPEVDIKQGSSSVLLYVLGDYQDY